MKKLASGRGNLLAQAESFRDLGVEVKREINPDLVEQATADETTYGPEHVAHNDIEDNLAAPEESLQNEALRVSRHG